MSARAEVGRGPSPRAARWLLFGALCAGAPAPMYLFVVVIAPLWAHAVVMLSAHDAATFGAIAVQVAVCGAVFHGVSRAIVWGLRRLPATAWRPALAVIFIAALAPLCMRAYAICYSQCNRMSVLELIAQVSAS